MEIIINLHMGNPVNYIHKILLFLFLSILSAQDSVAVDSSQSQSNTKGIESETISISAVVKTINVAPTAYRLSIYPRNHPAELLIQKIFFPDEVIQIIIPASILNAEPLGNVAKLEPLGAQYEPQYRMFNSGGEDIILQAFTVLVPVDILKLTVLEEESGNPIPFSIIRVTQNGKLLSNAVCDSSGYVRVRVPVTRDKKDPVLISINTEGKFPTWKGHVLINEGVSEKTILIASIKLDNGETIYQVNDELVSFNKGPENGSEVLFLLNIDDQIVISRVAGDRMYGRVRVYLSNQETYTNVYGWILSRYINILE
jgi:hypothetical protein